jgi:hypothetical protein
MSAWDLLAVLGAVALVVACVALFAAAGRMVAAARSIEATADEFRAAVAPLLADLADSTERAAGEVERVEQILDLSEVIGRRMDTASGATYRAITTPAIKGAAIAEGTRKAVRRLGRRA